LKRQPPFVKSWARALLECNSILIDADRYELLLTNFSLALESSSELKLAFLTPELSLKEKSLIIERSLDLKEGDVLLNMLVRLARLKRFQYLEDIALAFSVLNNERKKIIQAVYEVPFTPDEASIQSARSWLEKRFSSKNIDLRIEIRKELIAGYRIISGDIVYDTSIACRLKEFKSLLHTK